MGKNLVEEDKLNKKSFKRFLLSFKYCYEGMKYAFYHEVNIFVMIVMAILAVLLGMILKLSYIESLVIVLLIGIMLSIELVNCAIEEAINMAGKDNDVHAKHAKDCASGAVGIVSVMSLIIGIMIYLPKIIGLFK